MRETISLECSECKRRNYRTSREGKGGVKLELLKFCPQCRKRTTHKEKKK